MLKKISTLVFIVTITAIIMLLSACSNGDKTQKIILRLANNHAEGYPTSIACDEFAKLVKERTNGRIKIKVYHGAELGEEKSTIEQVQVGGIDFARVSISPLAEIEDSFNALQLPYLYRDEEHMWKVLNGEIGENFLNSDKLKGKSIIGLNWYSGGSRNFYNTKKEIKTPHDLKGLKIRVQESMLMMGLIAAMGAEPTPMTFEEVYSGLQTGRIDGAENNLPSYVSTSHYKVAKYITFDQHTRVPEMIIASTKTMDSLSKEDQEIIKQAAKESTQKQLVLWKAYEKETKQKAKESGCVITYLDEEQSAAFKAAVADLNKIEGAKYTEIIDAIEAVE